VAVKKILRLIWIGIQEVFYFIVFNMVLVFYDSISARITIQTALQMRSNSTQFTV